MRWFDMLSIGERVEQAKKEAPDERYARVEFDLGAAENVGKNIKIMLSGDFLAKIKYNGTATGAYFKFGNKRSSPIYCSEFRKRHTPFIPFEHIYLTNEIAQPGKVFTVFVGGAFAGEIEPSTGIKTGLTDSDGVDIDPATVTSNENIERRFKSHTPGQIDRRELAVIDTAEAIATIETKVRWCIIHIDTADAMIGATGLTNKAGAHPGVLAQDAAYISLEYVDLNEVFIVNEDGAVKPYFSVVYVAEET